MAGSGSACPRRPGVRRSPRIGRVDRRIVCDGIRNIRVRPALQGQIGRESFAPEQRFLSADESFAVAVEFRRRHPGRLRLLTQVLGWDDLRSDTAVREFVHTRPFVAFRPAPRPKPPVG